MEPVINNAHEAGENESCGNPNCIACATEKLENAVLIHGPNHPLIAQLCYDLGSLNQSKGDLKKALEYFEKSLELRQSSLGNKAEETIDSRYRIGSVLATIGDISETDLISHRLETLRLRQAFDSSELSDYMSSAQSDTSVSIQCSNSSSFHLMDGSVQIARKYVGFIDSTLIYNDVADDARSRFDYVTADDMYIKSITLRRKKFGHKSPAVSKVLINFAESKRLQGELDEAESVLREALLINHQFYGSLHENVAKVMNCLGQILVAKGLFDDAEILLREGLRLRLLNFGGTNVLVGSSYSNLAELFREKGDYVGALACHKSAIEAFEQSVGVDHPGAANARGNMGVTLHRQARVGFDRGDVLVKEAIGYLHEKGYAAQHPWILKFNFENSLTEALKLTESGRYNKALELYDSLMREYETNKLLTQAQKKELLMDRSTAMLRKGKDLFRKGLYFEVEDVMIDCLQSLSSFLAPDDPYRVKALFFRAENKMCLGDCSQAKDIFVETLQTRIDTLGPDHPEVIEVMISLADWHKTQALYTEAETLTVQALDYLIEAIKTNPPGALSLVYTKAFLGLIDLYVQKNNFDKVVPLLEQAEGLCEGTGDEPHPCSAEFLTLQSLVYLAQSKFQEALVCNTRIHDIRHNEHGGSHPGIAANNFIRGKILSAMGSYDAAKKSLNDALDLQLKFFPSNHPFIARTKYEMGLISTSLADYTGANLLLSESLAISEALYGKQHPEVAATIVAMGHVCRLRGVYAEAQTKYDEAYGVQSELYATTEGVVHFELAETLLGIAANAVCFGNYFSALATYASALDMLGNLSAQLGVEATIPQAEAMLANANALCKVWRIADAKLLVGRAVETIEELVGSDSLKMTEAFFQAAEVTKLCGEYKSARVLYSKALALQVSTLGSEHPNVVGTLLAAADNLRLPGYYHDALRFCEIALAILKCSETDNKKPLNLRRRILVASIICDQGEGGRLKEDMKPLMKAIRELVGEESDMYINALKLTVQNGIDELSSSTADTNLKRAIAIGNGCYDEAEPVMMEFHLLKARILFMRDMAAEALRLLESTVLPVCVDTFGSRHPLHARTVALIGMCKEKATPLDIDPEAPTWQETALEFFDTYPHLQFTADHPWVLAAGGYKTSQSLLRKSAAVFQRGIEAWALPAVFGDRSLRQPPPYVTITLAPAADGNPVVAVQVDAVEERKNSEVESVEERAVYLNTIDPSQAPPPLQLQETTRPTTAGSAGAAALRSVHAASAPSNSAESAALIAALVNEKLAYEKLKEECSVTISRLQSARDAAAGRLKDDHTDQLASLMAELESKSIALSTLQTSSAEEITKLKHELTVKTDAADKQATASASLQQEVEQLRAAASTLRELQQVSTQSSAGGKTVDKDAEILRLQVASADTISQLKRELEEKTAVAEKEAANVAALTREVEELRAAVSALKELKSSADSSVEIISKLQLELAEAKSNAEKELTVMASLQKEVAELRVSSSAATEASSLAAKSNAEALANEAASAKIIEELKKDLASLKNEFVDLQELKSAQPVVAVAVEASSTDETSLGGPETKAEVLTEFDIKKQTSMEAAKYMIQRGTDLSELGKCLEADPFLAEGVRIRERYHPGNQLTVDARLADGKNKVKMFLGDEAAKILALCGTNQIFLSGPVSASLVDIIMVEAENLVMQGFYREAGDKYKRLEKIFFDLDDSTSVQYSNYLNARAMNYLRLDSAPQAKALLDKAQVANLKDKGTKFDAIAETLLVSAELLRHEGNWAEAKPLLEQALSRKLTLYGADHVKSAAVTVRMAIYLLEQSLFDEADQRLKSALAVRSNIYKDDNPLICEIFHYQAIISHKRSDFKQAKQLHKLALAGRESSLGSVHLVTSYTYQAMGQLALDEGDYAKARELFSKVHNIRKECMDSAHSTVAEINFWQAETERRIGNFPEAKRLYDAAMEVQTQVYGKAHYIYARSELGLADFNSDVGYFEKAERFYNRVLKVRGIVYGSEHVEFAECLNAYGECLRRCKKFGEAMEKLKIAFDIRKFVLGDEHFLLAETMNNMALTQIGMIEDQLLAEEASAVPRPPEEEDEEEADLPPEENFDDIKLRKEVIVEEVKKVSRWADAQPLDVEEEVAEESEEMQEAFLRDPDGLPIFNSSLFEDALLQISTAQGIFSASFSSPKHPALSNLLGNSGIVLLLMSRTKEHFISTLPKEDRKAIRRKQAELAALESDGADSDEPAEVTEPGTVEIDSAILALNDVPISKGHPWMKKFAAYRETKEKPPDDLELARIAYNKAEALRKAGEHHQADILYDEALSSQVEALTAAKASSNMEVALSILGKAENALAQYRLEIARSLFIQTLAIAFKIGKHVNFLVIHAKFGLAEILRIIRDYQSAKLLHDEVVALREEAFGADSLEMALSQLALADISREAGSFAEALGLARSALATRLELLGGAHEDVGACYATIGKILLCKGTFAEAHENIEKAFVVLRSALGEQHFRIAEVLQYRAEYKFELGKYFDARKEIGKALKIRVKVFGALQKHRNFTPSGAQAAEFLDILAALIKNDAAIEELQATHFTRFTALQFSEEEQRAIEKRQAEEEENSTVTKFLPSMSAKQLATWELPPVLFEYKGTPISNHPLIADSLCCRAIICMALADYEEARELIDGALHMRRSLFGDKSLAVSGVNFIYGQLVRRLGDVSKAMNMQKQVLEHRLQILGESHPDRADSVYAMAVIYLELTRLDDSLQLFKEALTLRRQMYGNRHNKTIEAWLGVGDVLRLQGKYAESTSTYMGLMETLRLMYGEVHPLIASVYQSQAELSLELGGIDKAYAEVDQAVSIRSMLLGEEHPDSVLSTVHMANVSRLRMSFLECHKTLENCIMLQHKKFDDSHPECLLTLLYLGINLLDMNKFSKARTILEKVVAAVLKVYGKFHAMSAIATAALADTFQYESFYKAAKELHSEAMLIRRRVFGDEHATVASSMHSLSLIAVLEGDVDGSVKGFEDALALRRKTLGQMHREVAWSLHILGATFMKQGKLPEAKAFLDRALAMRQTLLPADHPDISESFWVISILLYLQGKPDASFAMASRCLEQFRSTYGSTHSCVAKALFTLGEITLLLAKFDAAKTHFTDSLHIRHSLYRTMNPSHPEIAESYFGIAEYLRAMGVYSVPLVTAPPSTPFLEAQAQLQDESFYDADGQQQPHMEDIYSVISDVSADGGGAFDFPPEDPRDYSAVNLYQKAFGMLTRLFTQDHLFVLRVEFGLAETWRLIGRYNDAVEKYENILHRRRRTLGDGHLDTVVTFWGLGEALRAKSMIYPDDNSSGFAPETTQPANFRSKISVADHVSSVLGVKPSGSGNCDPSKTCKIALALAGKDRETIRDKDREKEKERERDRIPGLPVLKKTAKGKIPNLGYMGYSFPDVKKLQRSNVHSVVRPSRVCTNDCKWLYDTAMSLFKKIFGESYDHPLLALILFSKGELMRARNNPDLAVPALEQAVVMRKKLFRSDHPTIADCLNGLAEILRADNKFQEAEAVYSRVLEIRLQVYNSKHPSIAEVESNIAVMFFNQGRYAEAKTLFTAALDMREALLGPAHPAVGQSLNNLGGVMQILGEGVNAEPLYERAIQIKVDVLGPRHPDVASSKNNMGLLLKALGRPEEALEMYLDALDIQRSTLGINHADVATSLHNLAGLYVVLGRRVEARETYRQVVEMKKRLLGPDHPSLASSLNNFAGLLHGMDELEDAKDLYEDALRIRRKVFGEFHPTVAETLNNVALLLFSQNQVAEAQPIFLRAIDIKIAVFGPDNPSVATSLQNLAALLQKSGRADEAAAYYAEAQRIRQVILTKSQNGKFFSVPVGEECRSQDGESNSFIRDGEDDGLSLGSALQFN